MIMIKPTREPRMAPTTAALLEPPDEWGGAAPGWLLDVPGFGVAVPRAMVVVIVVVARVIVSVISYGAPFCLGSR